MDIGWMDEWREGGREEFMGDWMMDRYQINEWMMDE